MTAVKDAAEALRRIYDFNKRPDEYEMMRYVALEALSNRLKYYASELPGKLNEAYNIRCRQNGWCPVPFSDLVLIDNESCWLQFEREKSVESVASLTGFKALQTAAENAGVLLTLCIRPDGGSVTCNFLAETSGEAKLVFI